MPTMRVEPGRDTGIGELVGVAVYEPLVSPVPGPEPELTHNEAVVNIGQVRSKARP